MDERAALQITSKPYPPSNKFDSPNHPLQNTEHRTRNKKTIFQYPNISE